MRTFFFAVVLNACPSVEELKYLQSAGKRGEELEGWCVIVYTEAACYLENLPAFSNIKLGHANVIKMSLYILLAKPERRYQFYMKSYAWKSGPSQAGAEGPVPPHFTVTRFGNF